MAGRSGSKSSVVVRSPRALAGIVTDAVAKFAGLVQLQRQRLERLGLPNPAMGVEVGFRQH